MICQQGRLVAIDRQRALIEVFPGQACATCRAGRGCGMAIFSGWFARGPLRVALPLEPGWKRGDSIALEIPPGALLRLAWFAYGVPLLLLLAGLAAGMVVAHFTGLNQDLAAAVAGALGLAGGIVLIRRGAGREIPLAGVRR